MKKIIIISILIFTFLNCNKDINKQDIHEIYNKCYSKKIKKEGKPVNILIKEFEEELINNNYLENSSGKSYIKFMQEMGSYDFIILKSNYSFIDSIRGYSYDEERIKECPSEISNHNKFDKTIFGKLKKYIQKKGTHKDFFSSMPLDSILTKEDFKFDYIKQKIFSNVRIYKKNEIQNGRIYYKKENYPKKVVLKLNSKNQILWNTKEIKLNKLKGKLNEYFSNYSNEKIVFIETDKETKLEFYFPVMGEIEFFKNNFYDTLSKKLFNKNYSNLDKSESWKIQNQYKLKFIK